MKILLIFLLFCTTAFAEELHFDLPKNDAKEQCEFVREAYSLKTIEDNEKQININSYKPIRLFVLNYHNTIIYRNSIRVSIADTDDCDVYYSIDKILGIDCKTGRDWSPADLDDLLTQDIALRYTGDCVAWHHNEPGQPTKKIIENCFTEVKNQKPQKNDLIIKNCNVEIVN